MLPESGLRSGSTDTAAWQEHSVGTYGCTCIVGAEGALWFVLLYGQAII